MHSNNPPLKTALIMGTRPEAIKLIPVYFELKRRGVETVLVSTGQHKEMLQQVFEWFDVVPDLDLDVMTANQSLAMLTSNIIQKLDSFFSTQPVDIVLVQGDTTTAFASSLVAFYHKIKVAHVEAGLRTFNKFSPWPEEINRCLISRLADLHFAPTSWSETNLLQEGIKQSNIVLTGNTVIDALLYSVEKVKQQNIQPKSLTEFFNGAHAEKPIILITGHRRENWGKGFEDICHAIGTLATQHKDMFFIYPVHLNPNVKNIVHEKLGNLENVILVNPLNYPEFISLMNRCYLILTDSGGVQEEAPSLGKPVVLMRDTTERPEGVESGNVKLTGTSPEKIIEEVNALINNKSLYEQMSALKNPYGDGRASEIITDSILSFQSK